MKKTLLLLLLAVATLAPAYSFSQESTSPSRPNEIYGGYGALSIFYFTGNLDHNYDDSYYHNYDNQDPSSPGTFFIGYNRQLNKVVSIGIVLSYMQTTNSFEYHDYNSSLTYNGTNHESLITEITRVTFGYLNRPSLKVYSGIGMGVTIDLNEANFEETTQKDRKILPAGQLTFIGIRFGKAFGGFVEFGVGSNGIMQGGLSYRIAD
jgi:opacity protein-like surface antigen